MGEIKDPIFIEDFPWVLEERELTEHWRINNLIEGDNWVIYDFPGLSALAYADFLSAFQRDECENFKLNETFKIYDFQKLNNDTYEHYLLVIQDNILYKFDLKKMGKLLDNNR